MEQLVVALIANISDFIAIKDWIASCKMCIFAPHNICHKIVNKLATRFEPSTIDRGYVI